LRPDYRELFVDWEQKAIDIVCALRMAPGYGSYGPVSAASQGLGERPRARAPAAGAFDAARAGRRTGYRPHAPPRHQGRAIAGADRGQPKPRTSGSAPRAAPGSSAVRHPARRRPDTIGGSEANSPRTAGR
ncbi:hypothetical protein ABT315_43920, partial [Streptomyces puniciscabiei]